MNGTPGTFAVTISDDPLWLAVTGPIAFTAFTRFVFVVVSSEANGTVTPLPSMETLIVSPLANVGSDTLETCATGETLLTIVAGESVFVRLIPLSVNGTPAVSLETVIVVPVRKAVTPVSVSI